MAVPGLSFLDVGTRRLTARAAESRHCGVRSVRRRVIQLTYREAPQRAMERELPHWRWTEILRPALFTSFLLNTKGADRHSRGEASRPPEYTSIV